MPQRANGKRKKPTGSSRVGLTKVEQEAWDLREQGFTWAQCSRKLEKDYRTIQNAYARAEKKMPNLGKLTVRKQHLQRRDPDKYAEFVEELTNPEREGESVASIAKRLNIPQTTGKRLAQELRSVYFPTGIELKQVKLERLKDAWSMTAWEALNAITKEKLDDSSAAALATVAGIATDKLLLLRAQPMGGVRSQAEREKLDVLAKAFLHEIDRRGYAVRTDAATGRVDLIYKSQANP